ncbi:MAG TPA: c-type cytochrome [Beijerinckiaceae bacterium]|jgi:cytochrome c553
MKAKHAILAVFCMGLAAPAAAQSLAPPGAAACSGCHAPAQLGSPVPPIRGRDAKEIVQAMHEFRSGARPATVMDRIAKGFSDDETQAIAAWLSAQK